MTRTIALISTLLLSLTLLASTANARPGQHRGHDAWSDDAAYDAWDDGVDTVSYDDARDRRADRRADRRHQRLIRGPVEVHWGNSWWDAEVLASSNGRYLVHYTGWSSMWDEWVGRDRIRRQVVAPIDLEVRPRVKVLYGGQWYDALVLAEGPAGVKVHYIGWSTSFDEWVAPERVRGAGTAPIRRVDLPRSRSQRGQRVEARGGYSRLIARR